MSVDKRGEPSWDELLARLRKLLGASQQIERMMLVLDRRGLQALLEATERLRVRSYRRGGAVAAGKRGRRHRAPGKKAEPLDPQGVRGGFKLK